MSKKRIITGILSLNKRGFGFVKPDDDSFEKDVFIPKRFINFAMNEDLVEVELENRISPKGPEGKIVKIIKRKKDTFSRKRQIDI